MRISNIEDLNAAVKVMLKDLPTFKAEASRELGISRETIRTATRGNITVSTLCKLCKICNYTVEIRKKETEER